MLSIRRPRPLSLDTSMYGLSIIVTQFKTTTTCVVCLHLWKTSCNNTKQLGALVLGEFSDHVVIVNKDKRGKLFDGRRYAISVLA